MPWGYGYDNDYEPRPSMRIYALRKEGRLDEARRLAEELIRNHEADDDVWKAYAWTLIDICKRCLENGNQQGARGIVDYLVKLSKNKFEQMASWDEFAETLVKKINYLSLSTDPNASRLQEAKDLSKNGQNDRAYEIYKQLSTEGNLPVAVHESYGWTIYKYLRDNYRSLSSEQVRNVLRDYLALENPRPSALHSQILNFSLNYSKQDSNFKFLSFFKLWGPTSFDDEDYEDSTGNDGTRIPSLLSRIARAVIDYPSDEVEEIVELMEDDKDAFIELLREHFFWKVYRSTEEGLNNRTWELFEQYLDFYPESPASVFHSKVLSLAERVMKENNEYRFYNFFKKWNPEKLSKDDWKEEKGNNGEVYKPLAVKAIKKAKEALKTLSEEQIGDLQWLIDLYGVTAERFPDDDWIIRSKAQLHLRAGQLAEAKMIYRDLCLKIGDKYYIWSEFAECWKDTKVKIALLCKALSLEKNEDFLGKIRLELARQLIKAKKYENAKVELEQYKKHYTKMGWRVDNEVDTLLDHCSSASTICNNKALYEENIPIAEEHAYADIPYTELVLVDKWTTEERKVMMTFVDGDKIEFAINNKRFPALRDSHEGQAWKFKLYKDETVKTIPSEYSWRPSKKETIIKYIPLIVASSKTADWQVFPIKYGYIQHVNTEKRVYHIYSTESKLVFEHFEEQTFKKGDFVSFRQYTKKVKEEKRVFFKDIKQCDEAEGLEQFKCGIAAVDDMNTQKQLFHFVLGHISGILHYDQTELRPSVGDCIKIYYFVREKEDKKNLGRKIDVVEVIKSESTDEVNEELIKDVSGLLELKYYDEYELGEPDFAFVGDYYVHKSILRKYSIDSDCHVKGRAVYTGDGKWKVFKIEKV